MGCYRCICIDEKDVNGSNRPSKTIGIIKTMGPVTGHNKIWAHDRAEAEISEVERKLSVQL